MRIRLVSKNQRKLTQPLRRAMAVNQLIWMSYTCQDNVIIGGIYYLAAAVLSRKWRVRLGINPGYHAAAVRTNIAIVRDIESLIA